MATNSSILAYRLPWTEEPGGLLSMESQRVRQDLATKHAYMHVAHGHQVMIYGLCLAANVSALLRTSGGNRGSQTCSQSMCVCVRAHTQRLQ